MTAPILAALDALAATPIPLESKGFRPDTAGRATSAAALREHPEPLFGGRFTFPLAVLERAALDHNIAEMARYCAARGVALAPHGKTAMSPEIAAAQIAAGAWGITVASVAQAMAYRRYGFTRLLIANQVTDGPSLDWLADTLAADDTFEPIVCLDSIASAELAAERIGRAASARRLDVLVELGHPGGRTGARTIGAAVAVGAAAAATGRLRPIGVTGYEGTLGGAEGQPELVRRYCTDLVEVGRRLVEASILPREHVVSAGGSVFFTEVCAAVREANPHAALVLRSGAYVVHDHGHYERITPAHRGAADAPRLLPAVTVWAPVLSAPEPGLAILALGRRDVGFDEGLPRPLAVRGADGITRPLPRTTLTALNDQHGYLTPPAGITLAPGDLVQVGISHPCTTFDKWRVLAVADGDRVVGLIHTYF